MACCVYGQAFLSLAEDFIHERTSLALRSLEPAHVSNLYQSGPRMKGSKSDWRVNGGMRPGRKTTERKCSSRRSRARVCSTSLGTALIFLKPGRETRAYFLTRKRPAGFLYVQRGLMRVHSICGHRPRRVGPERSTPYWATKHGPCMPVPAWVGASCSHS